MLIYEFSSHFHIHFSLLLISVFLRYWNRTTMCNSISIYWNLSKFQFIKIKLQFNLFKLPCSLLFTAKAYFVSWPSGLTRLRERRTSNIIEAGQLLMLFKQYQRVYSLSVSTWHNCSNSMGIPLDITWIPAPLCFEYTIIMLVKKNWFANKNILIRANLAFRGRKFFPLRIIL